METSEKAKELLAIEGYDPNYGARPLRRTIERLIENPISEKIFGGRICRRRLYICQNKRKKLIFSKKING